jgi:quercetin dioxygenase-like cupin family protein
MVKFENLAVAANRGPSDWFRGDVWVQPLLGPEQSPSQRSAVVSFSADARTAWHVHPRGQMVYVISGLCEAQREGGPVEHAGPGDAFWFAPGEKHWHGAAANRPMVHLAVQEADESGSGVTWMEQVTR